MKVYANDQRKITCGEFSKSVCSLSSGHNLFLFFHLHLVCFKKMIGYLSSISSSAVSMREESCHGVEGFLLAY